MSRKKPVRSGRRSSRPRRRLSQSTSDLSSRVARLEAVIVEMRRDLRTQFQRIAQLQAELDRQNRRPL